MADESDSDDSVDSWAFLFLYMTEGVAPKFVHFVGVALSPGINRFSVLPKCVACACKLGSNFRLAADQESRYVSTFGTRTDRSLVA